jgi:hypothetical protein
VTKKPFGIRVSPSDSPVQPERFVGYHSGVDFEIKAGEEDQSLPVTAICAGEVKLVEMGEWLRWAVNHELRDK